MLIAALVFAVQAAHPAAASDLPTGIDNARYEEAMRNAIAVGRAGGSSDPNASAVCTDISSAIGDLLHQRTSAQGAKTELDAAYLDQVTENASADARSPGRQPSDWENVTMKLLLSHRGELVGRIEDQNVALYALAQAGLAFCSKD
jgi:hypothetical protein